MKKFTLLALLFVITATSAHAQNKLKNVFRGYLNDENVMAYSVSGKNAKDLLENIEGEEIKSSLDDIYFLMFKEGDNLSDKDLKRIKKAIKKDNFQQLIKIKDKGNSSIIYAIMNDDIIKVVYANVSSPKGTAYLFVEGNILFEEISKIDFSKVNALAN